MKRIKVYTVSALVLLVLSAGGYYYALPKIGAEMERRGLEAAADRLQDCINENFLTTALHATPYVSGLGNPAASLMIAMLVQSDDQVEAGLRHIAACSIKSPFGLYAFQFTQTQPVKVQFVDRTEEGWVIKVMFTIVARRAALEDALTTGNITKALTEKGPSDRGIWQVNSGILNVYGQVGKNIDADAYRLLTARAEALRQ